MNHVISLLFTSYCLLLDWVQILVDVLYVFPAGSGHVQHFAHHFSLNKKEHPQIIHNPLQRTYRQCKCLLDSLALAEPNHAIVLLCLLSVSSRFVSRLDHAFLQLHEPKIKKEKHQHLSSLPLVNRTFRSAVYKASASFAKFSLICVLWRPRPSAAKRLSNGIV